MFPRSTAHPADLFLTRTAQRTSTARRAICKSLYSRTVVPRPTRLLTRTVQTCCFLFLFIALSYSLFGACLLPFHRTLWQPCARVPSDHIPSPVPTRLCAHYHLMPPNPPPPPCSCCCSHGMIARANRASTPARCAVHSCCDGVLGNGPCGALVRIAYPPRRRNSFEPRGNRTRTR